MQIKKTLETMTSRTGRHMQRYNEGSRQVVGCIPFRFRNTKESSSPSIHGTLIDDLEVLLISSQKNSRMMFPKGGWETDETIEEAARRETFEEAGVLGIVWNKLGIWNFKSKSQDAFHEGYMLPLLVTEELEIWPEKDVRNRQWMSFNEARDVCAHPWMTEALDVLIHQLKPLLITEGENSLDVLIRHLMLQQRTEDEDFLDVMIHQVLLLQDEDFLYVMIHQLMLLQTTEDERFLDILNRHLMLLEGTEDEHFLDVMNHQLMVLQRTGDEDFLDVIYRQVLVLLQRTKGEHPTTCSSEFLSKEPNSLVAKSGDEEVPLC